jgi:NAD(P)H-nitrite reductase large subunit
VGEAAGYLAALARYRVPYRVRHAVVAAHANPRRTAGGLDVAGFGRSALGWDSTDRPDSGPRGGRLSSVDVARLDEHGQVVPGSARRISCDAVAVGYGFTANLELALALGCATRLTADGGLAVAVGPHGESSVDGVFAAGEVTGVGGARLAVVEGQLAGAAAAQAGGATTRTALSARDTAALLRRQQRLRAFADTMHGAHRVPAGWLSWLREQTLVCRCEEVTHADVMDAVTELGATDPRSVKLLTRTGMGWCQGRQCGYAVAAITARSAGRDVAAEDLLAFANRPLAVPVRLGDLADPAQ